MSVYKSTRYNCLTNIPPHLASVLRELRKQKNVKKDGCMPRNARIFLSFARSADAEYDNPGRSDDLRRFLINTAVLVEDKASKVDYFDDVRAEHIEWCCDNHVNPSTSTDPNLRLTQLKQKVVDRKALEAVAKILRVHTDIDDSPEDGKMADVKNEDEGQGDIPEVAPPEVPRLPISPDYVLHLLPIEDDVWTTLCALAKKTCTGEIRIATDAELDEFAQRYASQNLAERKTSHEWKLAVDRFLSNRLLARIEGAFRESEIAYRMCEDWQRFRVVKIFERQVCCESNPEAREATRAFTVLREHVDYYQLMERGLAYGLRHELPNGQTLPSWPGFERVDFCDHGVPAPEMPPELESEPEPELVTGADESQQEIPAKYWLVQLNREQATFLLEIVRNGEMQNIKDAFDYKNRMELVRIGLLVRRGERRWSTWVVDSEVAKRCLFRVSYMRTAYCREENRSKIPDPNDWVSELSRQIGTPKEISVPVGTVAPEGVDDPPPNVESVDGTAMESGEPDVSTGGVTSDNPDPESLTDEEIELQMLVLQGTIDSLKTQLDKLAAIKKARTEEKMRAFEKRRRELDEQAQALEARKRELEEERKAIDLEMQALQ